MSAPLVVSIPHKLGKEEALRRVKPALSKASESFPMLAVEQEVWSGDRMDFRVRAKGQVAAGNIQVGENDVRLEVTPVAAAQIWSGRSENYRWERPDHFGKEMTL